MESSRVALPPRPESRTSGGAWAVALVLAAFLSVYLPLQQLSSARRSATADEPLHLTAGYVALTEADFRFDPTHPPLLRLWAASALRGRVTRAVEMTGLGSIPFGDWAQNSYKFSSDFLYGGGDGPELLEAARFRIMVLGALLGLLVFAWVYECLGIVPATLALALYAAEPNLAGHGALVTTDLGVSCFFFGAVYFLWRVQRRFSAANVAGLAFFAALAVTSKYSAVLLGPVLVLLLAVMVRGNAAVTAGRALAVLALVGAACFVAIWAVYGFRYAAGPGGELVHGATKAVVARQVPRLAAVGAWIDARHLLPNAFTQGFLLSQATAQALPGFLNGEIRQGGWWYYFPVAFLMKTPSALLVLAAAGLVGLARVDPAGGVFPRAFVLVPVGVYLAFAMASPINLGVRHILPIYPFVICVAAVAMNALYQARRPVSWAVLGLALGIAGYRYLAVWPANLTFFNAFAGGPANGGKLLTDSNLDWGQHLKTLKRWMDDHGVAEINLAYVGTIDPGHYGITGPCLPGSPSYSGVGAPRLPGYVAISSTILSGVYLDAVTRLLYSPFRSLVPTAVVGNAIHVFWVERWPVRVPAKGAPDEVLATYLSLADALLFDAKQPEMAIPFYRAYLAARPADGSAVAKLGYAHLAAGSLVAARPLLQRAVDLADRPGRMGAEIALALLQRSHAEEAMRVARESVARSPDEALAHDALGIVLVFQDRPDEALAAFNRALQLAPGSESIRSHVGEMRRRLGR